MQVSSEKLYDELRNLKKIEKDEKFDFFCARCGACCRLYENITLKPFDVFRLSKSLSLAPRDFIREYCELRQDQQSKLPSVKFRKSNDNSKYCRFLIKGKCSVYAARPSSCALYPLNRITDLETGCFAYYLQPDICGEKQPAVLLSEWLASYGIEEYDNHAAGWYKWLRASVNDIISIFSSVENLPAEVLYTFFEYLYAMLYINYDITSGYTEQFLSNCEKIDDVKENLLLEIIMKTTAGGID